MAGGEGITLPSDYGAVSGDGIANPAGDSSSSAPAPRVCIVCRNPLAPDELKCGGKSGRPRKLHRGRCEHEREIQLQKLRRGRARVPRRGIVK